MFRIRIWYADFGVVMASRVWRGRRALGLSVRVARLAGPGAAPARPAQHILTVYCLEWRFRMPETARPTHRQCRQEHSANPGTRARRHAPTRPPPRSRRGEEACLCTDRRHRDADPSGCDVTLPIPYRTSCNHCEVLRRFVRHFRRTHRQ
jgi:hypothetical protein